MGSLSSYLVRLNILHASEKSPSNIRPMCLLSIDNRVKDVDGIDRLNEVFDIPLPITLFVSSDVFDSRTDTTTGAVPIVST